MPRASRRRWRRASISARWTLRGRSSCRCERATASTPRSAITAALPICCAARDRWTTPWISSLLCPLPRMIWSGAVCFDLAGMGRISRSRGPGRNISTRAPPVAMCLSPMPWQWSGSATEDSNSRYRPRRFLYIPPLCIPKLLKPPLGISRVCEVSIPMAAMAAMALGFEDGIHNVHDPRLRPALLQAVMQTHLPEDHHLHRSQQERHFIGSGSRLAQLEFAATLIRRHALLSEPMAAAAVAPGLHPFHGGAAAKAAADARKCAVDAWVERLHGLLSSPVADSRYAGVGLLGITFQEFTRQRFLESYVSWFQKLLVQLKPTEPTFIRAAVCAALNDFLTRLGSFLDYPGVRREGAALASKLVQTLVQLLTDKDSCAIWNEAIDLLATVLKYFPACLRQHYSNVESILVAQIMDADGNIALSERCARCLALLPRAHGEASAWSAMVRRILIAVNSELDRAFRGMEEVNAAEEATMSLQPREGGWHFAGANMSTQGNKRFWQQLVPRISSLLQSCHYLLVNPYPVPVPVPILPLLALSTRILRVDGSRLPAASPLCVSVSSAHQTALCSELPALHLCALNLLHSTICGARSQLLPRAAHIVHLLTDAFRRCGAVPPGLRVKLYGISKHLLISLGAGMAEALAPVVVGNALSDLRGSASGSFVFSPRGTRPGSTMSTVAAWGPGINQKKRKEPGGVPVDHQGNGMPDASCFNEIVIPVSVQISALQALEALLTAGGAMLPERVRAEVDSLLASIAILASSKSASGGGFDDESTSLEGNLSAASASFQVAAYKALLASLLSPCAHRPPYLAQGLSIFRKGRKDAGSEVAEVCAHALLALEALIHPRCLPPLDTPAAVASGMAASAVAGARGSASGNPSTNPSSTQKLAKTSSNAAANVGAVPAGTPPTGISFAAPSAPPAPPALKVNNQLAVDPWAEVDTWLGYGEDIGEDWRGLLAEDLSGEGLVFKGDQQSGGSEQPAATAMAEAAGDEVIPMDPLRYVDIGMPATATSMSILSTPGGEFSSSPKRDILDVARAQVATSLQNDFPSFARLMDSEDQQQDSVPGKQEPCSLSEKAPVVDLSSFAASKITLGSDSETDALPDIIDGDPDSD
ncbi:uncharacterized protein LOC9642071 [Selaginella moellendorffii]|uniref:uncharacterized protein LOC9642071 n=1 Tax=Selaginella moellendorffii TaxID=88036 RepID=UPI000D1C5155|nr:uncharacterized protein LOC9642071 [Selaginella moellendorffii]XP_024531783.1 uncharacterized protein LOC9642071 [Selaginella moellendorffii]|eukprot:XP_024531782.1 uncharacterized protein LOC9642071 [Selaginella moellendorffii]